MARRRHGFTNTKFRWPREAVSLVLTDRRKLGIQPRRGANHIGIADTSERWFYTGAGLHNNTPERRTPCVPRRSRYIVKKSELSRTHATSTPTISTLSRPTRRDGAGERGQHKAMFKRHVYRRGHGLCRRPHHTHTPSSSCMENRKRRRQRRPHGLIGGISRINPRE